MKFREDELLIYLMEEYKLEKYVWTEKDYENMGFNLATVHSIGFVPTKYELMFDIDYIFRRIDPKPPSSYYTLWIAPATLVFRNINEQNIEIGGIYGDGLQLDGSGINRLESRSPRNADYIEDKTEWKWIIDMHYGEASFWSTGYNMYVRQEARLFVKTSLLSLEERGGISFDQQFQS